MPVPRKSFCNSRWPTPGGTVLFITTTRSRGFLALTQPTAALTWLRSAAPLSVGGVPVAITAASPSGSATSSRCRKRNRPLRTPSATRASRPGS